MEPTINADSNRHFKSCFWSHDYTFGVEALCSFLNTGVAESDAFLATIQKRAAIEARYSEALSTLSQGTKTYDTVPESRLGLPFGFQSATRDQARLSQSIGKNTRIYGDNDDQAELLRSPLSALETTNSLQADIHNVSARRLMEELYVPLQQFVDQHREVVNGVSAQIRQKIVEYNKLEAEVSRARAAYYAKKQRQSQERQHASPNAADASFGAMASTLRAIKERVLPAQVSPMAKALKQELVSSADTSIDSSHNTSIVSESSTIYATASSSGEPKATGESRPVYLAGLAYNNYELRVLLRNLLAGTDRTVYRVPILGSYENVSTGMAIAASARRLLQNDSIKYSERFGQALIDASLIRPVGQITNKFRSDTTCFYQWLPLALQLGEPLTESFDTFSPSRTSSEAQSSSSSPLSRSSSRKRSEAATKLRQLYNTSNHSPRTPSPESEEGLSDLSPSALVPTAINQRLERAKSMIITSSVTGAGAGAKDKRQSPDSPVISLGSSSRASYAASEAADQGTPELILESERYLQAVIELDKYRCDMESEFMNLYDALEASELGRRSQMEQAINDLVSINLAPQQVHEAQVRALAFAGRLDAVASMNTEIEKYSTGPFIPKVTVYRGFNDTVCQTFGIEVERSGFLLESLLDCIEQGVIEVKAKFWLEPYVLSEIYALRAQLNNGRPIHTRVLSFFRAGAVAGLIKQYLLELPDSLVPALLYDVIQDLYPTQTPQSELQDESVGPADLAVILSRMSAPAYSLFKRLLTYLAGLSLDISTLAKVMAPYLVRPQVVSIATQRHDHPRRFLTSLLCQMESTFEETENLRRLQATAATSAALEGKANPSRANLSAAYFSPEASSQQNLLSQWRNGSSGTIAASNTLSANCSRVSLDLSLYPVPPSITGTSEGAAGPGLVSMDHSTPRRHSAILNGEFTTRGEFTSSSNLLPLSLSSSSSIPTSPARTRSRPTSAIRTPGRLSFLPIGKSNTSVDT